MGPRPADDLDARDLAVLRTVVREHIASGQPVGSSTVARHSDLELSPATIRKILGKLAECGLLVQPHTSAGRVPTARGYRRYVDGMMRRPPRVASALARELERALDLADGDLPELLGAGSRRLAQLSQQIGLALAPEIGRLVVERLEFVPLDGRRVLAILVGLGGVVHHRVLPVDEPIEPAELERIGRFLSDGYRGQPLSEIHRALERRMREERATFDRLQAAGLTLCRRAVEARAEEMAVFVEGASALIESAAPADLDVLRGLFRTLEEKQRLVELLGRLLEGRGVRVWIGGEIPGADLLGCTVVASPYGPPGGRLGTIGVVGPMRMPYSRVIPLVSHLADVLTARLAPTEN